MDGPNLIYILVMIGHLGMITDGLCKGLRDSNPTLQT